MDPAIRVFVDETKRRLTSLGWSQRELAKRSGLAEATIYRVFAQYKCTPKTGMLIKRAFADVLRQGRGSEVERRYATPEYGGYSREDASRYLSWFRLYRRNYRKDKLRATLILFDWPEHEPGMLFYEYSYLNGPPKTREDHSQRGYVFMGQDTQLVHLLSHYNGSVRLITLTALRAETHPYSDHMYGLILSQFVGDVASFIPATSPVFLERLSDEPDDMTDYIVEFDRSDRNYARIDKTLRSTETRDSRCASLIARGKAS